MKAPTLKRPTLLVDLDICRRNIQRILKKTQANGATFRPHFKTHQSHTVGQLYRDEGIDQITVSSLEMAAYFISDRWADVFVAFPFNAHEIDLANELAEKADLCLLVESQETAAFLQEHLKHPVRTRIKLDVGTHRTGLDPKNLAFIKQLAHTLDHPLTNFEGLVAHAGHTYSAHGEQEILQLFEQTHRVALDVTKALQSDFPKALLSYGDTPTASRLDTMPGVDEWRPGNLVFYDWMQHRIGSCRPEDIAVAVACPVVALHSERQEAVVFGGAVHFSKDYIEEKGHKNYGQAVEWDGKLWGAPIENMYLKKLSQEHGIVHVPEDQWNRLSIGSWMAFHPIHSCLTADVMTRYQTLDGQKILAMKAEFSVD